MTKHNTRTLAALAAAAGLTAFNPAAQAQSSDALIDKLVDKGILSVKEANELREEADKNFTTAYAVKSGMPEWATSFKINGDFRARYESFQFDNNATADRNRYRLRARLGFTAMIKDQLEAGLRLGSGDLDSGVPSGGIDPLSNNQSLQNNGSKKGIFLDLAYGKWSPINSPDWTGVLTVGKLENPFVFPSTMMFDKDYTPEGATTELTYRFNADHSLKFTGGGFVVDENNGTTDNPALAGAQLRWDASWSSKLSTSLGASAWILMNSTTLTNGAVPNQGYGNTRLGGTGPLVYDYKPVQADTSVTYLFEHGPAYNAPFPVTVFGEVLHNSAAPRRNDGWATGITFGKSGKKGLWDLSYQYRKLEGDAWYEELTESDFGGNYLAAPAGGATGYRNGTNVRGHILRAQYSFTDALTVAATYWMTELIDANPANSESGARRLQIDATLKF